MLLSPPWQPEVLVQDGRASKGGSQAQPRHEDSYLESHPDTQWTLHWEKPLRTGGCHCTQPDVTQPAGCTAGASGLASTSALPPRALCR